MDTSQHQRNDSKTIILEIIGARDLTLSHWGKKPPKAFVKLAVGDFKGQTSVHERNTGPSWNETFTLTKVHESAILSFRVFHQPRLGRKDPIGTVDIALKALLERQGSDPHVELELTSENDHTNGGVLILCVKEEQLLRAATTALGDTRLAGQKVAMTLKVRDTVGPLIDIIPSLGPFIEIADNIATIHPFVNIAWQITSLVIKIPKGQLDRDQSIIDLISTMEDLYSYVTSVDGLRTLPIFEETVQQILNQTIECAFFIQAYFKHGFIVRTAQQSVSGMMEKISKFREAFLHLKERFTATNIIRIAFVSSRILGIVEDTRRDQVLMKLDPVKMPSAGRPSCLTNTRQEVIKFITAWITDVNHEKGVLWLLGLSGSGKSTISTTIANMLRELQHLAAFVFFNRDVKERSDPRSVIQTLAYNLALFDAQISNAVSVAIESTPTILESPLAFQFRKLLAEPLLSMASEYSGGPIVIVIDALDECGTARDRKELLSVFSQEFGKLPSFIRILITSRREHDIEAVFYNHPAICPLDITIYSASNDIKMFIKSQMAELCTDNPGLNLPVDWPGEEKVQALTQSAHGLFIWASTACAFVAAGHDPRQRIEQLTNISASTSLHPLHALDLLYKTALQHAGDWSDETFHSDCLSILGLICVVKNPLSSDSIDELLCLARPSLHTIKRLGSVLLWSEVKPIRILHPSFQDFLCSQDRCGLSQWFIDINQHHGDTASCCIKLLERKLKKNICHLTVKQPFNKDLISGSLSYASVYWIEHICSTTDINAEWIYTFLSQHLLHWMEVMSILNMSRRIIRLLQHLPKQTNVALHKMLSQLLYDAQRFGQYFVDVCEEHPLLVYATALSFCPIDTTIYRLFHRDRGLQVIGGLVQWPSLLLQIQGHNKPVYSAAFSHDGFKIVSGSKDRTIRVWDAGTGAEILPPLQGHTKTVNSIAISHDGSKIVSGSNDHTIRVWDAGTGAEILPPLQGHMGAVKSVAFSYDGSKIVSGSSDKTIRVWDIGTASGAEILSVSPLQSHGGNVSSVAFSHDGSKIVSGSYDQTIRVWNASTGAEILPPLQGHSNIVHSIAISHDGSKIVSGSSDKTIRVWNTGTGAELLSLLQGHNGDIFSVAFSHDGSKIVSGSNDHTVRVWNAGTGVEIQPPLWGHGDHVLSAVFSHDGSKIVSGSDDNTICVWDAGSGAETLPPLWGHDDLVFSIAFSHDESKIVSGSFDKTIRVWDASTGAGILSPLQGHDDLVSSVAFSHDGSKIVSGSYDQTIRVWDASTGAETLPPFQGHIGAVLSVAFTHDGLKIVSGSKDRTIRVWDAVTGAEILPPLQGHSNVVKSVAFSPDGSKIVSGSYDLTIRVWDAGTGVEVLPPLQGHKKFITSVAFLHNGSKIISNSLDKTIRVWDVNTGAEILPPFQGHYTTVSRAQFPYDWPIVVSGSHDQTSQIQNAITSTGSLILDQEPIGSSCKHRDSHIILPEAVATWEPQTGLILVDERRWITHIPTGCCAKLPIHVAPEHILTSYGSKLVGWTKQNCPIIIQFPTV